MALDLRNRTFSLLWLLLVVYSSSVNGQRVGKVKLSGGRDASEGNVMVAIGSSALFQPVCDDSFGMAEANAICVELGYPRALRFTHQNFFGANPIRWTPDGWISMYTMRCSNDSTSLGNCIIDNNRLHQCTEVELAGVVCQGDITLQNCSLSDFVCEDDIPTANSSSCIEESSVCDGFADCPSGSDERPELCEIEGIFRLESSIETALPDNTVAGTVYMKYNQEWGTVCDDSYGPEEAQVICRNLGYGGGLSIPFNLAYFGSGFGAIVADESSCLGDETSLSQCPGFVWGESNCIHREDAGVMCHDGTLDVQLVDGETPDSGRLEIKSSSISSPMAVCQTGFDDMDAQVVCRMLGYGDGSEAVALQGTPFGRGSGAVWNVILDCNGNETSIHDCRMKIANNTCTHSNTIGVTCLREKSVDTLLSRVLPADCGEPVDASDRFITSLGKVRGGSLPSVFDVPWLASFRFRTEDGYEHDCGGVIISEYYLLSAAHCFELTGKLRYLVSVGEFNNKFNDNSQQNYFIDKLWIHEGFEELGLGDNDIALIKIEGRNGRGMRLGERVKAACLPKVGDSYDGLDSCSITGWGIHLPSGESPSTPRRATTSSISDDICETAYGSRGYSSSSACFGRLAFVNACKGDSGGPLTCQEGPRGRQVLYGLVSVGKKCEVGRLFPGLFTRVTKYLRWIQETIYQDLRL